MIHWKQFSLALSVGITLHKSQGITCKNDGTSVFSDGQA